MMLSTRRTYLGNKDHNDYDIQHHHHHYHHRHRHYHWKKEAKRTLNEIKIYKQNGELSEALQKKMKAIDKAESGRYQNLSTKKKIKLIKLVMQAVLLEKDA